MLSVELPTYGRLDAGVASTTAIHAKDTTSIARPAASSCVRRRPSVPWPHTSTPSAIPGTTRYAASVFVLKASPTSTPLQISVRQRPVSVARTPASQARIISTISSVSTFVVRETATNDGNTASARAPATPAQPPSRRASAR